MCLYCVLYPQGNGIQDEEMFSILLYLSNEKHVNRIFIFQTLLVYLLKMMFLGLSFAFLLSLLYVSHFVFKFYQDNVPNS